MLTTIEKVAAVTKTITIKSKIFSKKSMKPQTTKTSSETTIKKLAVTKTSYFPSTPIRASLMTLQTLSKKFTLIKLLFVYLFVCLFFLFYPLFLLVCFFLSTWGLSSNALTERRNRFLRETNKRFKLFIFIDGSVKMTWKTEYPNRK